MEQQHLIDMAVTVVCAVMASSGFWTWFNNRNSHSEEKERMAAAQAEMLVGLAHDRIVTKGMQYIDRGYITKEEYENMETYLFKPYKKLGGNGSAQKIMEEINKLPIKSR